MIKRYFNRFPHAVRGITYALKNDFGFRSQVYLGGLVTILTAYFFFPLSSTEVLFLALAWALILITELQNSAFEIALDRLHPELHNSIKYSKDMAASSVLVAGLFLIIVLTVIGCARFI